MYISGIYYSEIKETFESLFMIRSSTTAVAWELWNVFINF